MEIYIGRYDIGSAAVEGRGHGRGESFTLSPMYCHNSYVPCAIRGATFATFAMDVENGLETKVKMITVANR